MRFWLIAAAIVLAGAVVGHFLKRRLCGILSGTCAAVSAGLYLYVKLLVHHNGLGAGLAVVAIWLFSAAAGLFLGLLTNQRKGNA